MNGQKYEALHMLLQRPKSSFDNVHEFLLCQSEKSVFYYIVNNEFISELTCLIISLYINITCKSHFLRMILSTCSISSQQSNMPTSHF